MSTTTISSRTHIPRRAMFGVGLGAYLARFHAGIRDARAMADRYDRLSGMSTPDLARHGLTRSDVPRACLTGDF